MLSAHLPQDVNILHPGRQEAADTCRWLIGADVVKNEITAHAVAASYAVEGVQTILEIGGQDSKIILLRNGVACDLHELQYAQRGPAVFRQASRHVLKSPLRSLEACAKSNPPLYV
jgi:hypothetical protein